MGIRQRLFNNPMSEDPQGAINFIRDNATAIAKARAERVYLEEFKKTQRALLMKEAEEAGAGALAAQERDALAHPKYIEVLNGLKVAVENEEKLRWLMVAAQVKVEVWRSYEASKRAEMNL